MLAKTGVCVDGAMGALPDVDCGGAEHVAWATAGLIACVLLVALTMRFARVDFDLKRIEATSLLDASGDALVHDGDNEMKTPLTSKSISYDIVKLQVKTGLTLAKLYVAGLGLTEEASAFGLALVVLLGGVVLLLIGLRFDQYYDPVLPGAPTLPGGLNANKLQTGLDLGVLVVFVAQVAAAAGWEVPPIATVAFAAAAIVGGYFLRATLASALRSGARPGSGPYEALLNPMFFLTPSLNGSFFNL